MIPRISRLDAGQNYFLARELEKIEAEEAPTLFAGVLWKSYVPRATDTAPYEKVHTYRMNTPQGQAKSMGPNANDAPQVNVTREEFSRPVRIYDASFGWSVLDIQAAAANGLGLDRDLAQAAMAAIARKIDRCVALGDGTQVTGLLTHPDVDDTQVPTTKTGGGTSWLNGTATATEILTDINTAVAQAWMRVQQGQSWKGGDMPLFQKFTMLLPLEHWALIAAKPRSDNSDTTILKYALQNNPMIEGIEPWWHCDTADGGDPMIVTYPRDKMCVSAVVPTEYEQLAPQEQGMNVNTPCYGSSAGTIIKYPFACGYLKGI